MTKCLRGCVWSKDTRWSEACFYHWTHIIKPLSHLNKSGIIQLNAAGVQLANSSERMGGILEVIQNTVSVLYIQVRAALFLPILLLLFHHNITFFCFGCLFFHVELMSAFQIDESRSYLHEHQFNLKFSDTESSFEKRFIPLPFASLFNSPTLRAHIYFVPSDKRCLNQQLLNIFAWRT